MGFAFCFPFFFSGQIVLDKQFFGKDVRLDVNKHLYFTAKGCSVVDEAAPLLLPSPESRVRAADMTKFLVESAFPKCGSTRREFEFNRTPMQIPIRKPIKSTCISFFFLSAKKEVALLLLETINFDFSKNQNYKFRSQRKLFSIFA